MKNFIHNLLTDSTGNYSSRLISGWIAFFVWVALLFMGYNLSEISSTILIYVASCFGLSVISEVANKTNL